MKPLVFIGLLLVSLSAWPSIDSLKGVLPKVLGTEEVHVLLKLSELYEQIDLDTALTYANQALTTAKSLNNKMVLAEAYNGRGIIYDYLGRYDEALDDYFDALHLHRAQENEEGEAGTLINIGLVMSFQARMDSALAYYEQALDKSIEIGQQNYESYVLNNIASLHIRQGHYRLALDYLVRSLELKEELGDRSGVVFSLYNLGVVYFNLKLPRKALSNYFRLLEDYAADMDKITEGDTYHNMGLIYQNALHIPDSAHLYYQKALAIRDTLGYMEGISETLSNLSTLYLSYGETDTALVLTNRALELDRQSKDWDHLAVSYNNLAKIYLDMDDPNKALKSIDQAEILIDSLRLRVKAPSVLMTKVQVLRKLGRFQEALEYYDRYTVASDSLLNAEISEQMLELETQYQSAKKDRAILEQELTLEAQSLSIERKNRWIAITAGGILSLGIILLLLYWNSRNKQRLHKQQVATMQREQELQRLKAMMAGEERERSRIAKNLHDGVSGMLSAIKLYFTSLGRDDPKLESVEPYTKARNLIDDTAKEVRTIAHNLMPDLLVRDGLAKALKQFCQHIQSSGMLEVNFQAINMEERLPQSMELTLYRIIQELLNNIMKHAKATEVVVQVSRHGNRVECTVEDNGRGFRAEKGAEGAGLETIRNRLQYLDGELDIDSEEGHGTSVHIVVTLDKQQPNP